MKAKKEKSTNGDGADKIQYPAKTLPICLEVAKILSEHGASLKPLSRKEACVALGKAEATMIMVFPACIQYGLLKNIFGSGYQVTELFEKIESPVYQDDKRKYLLDAMISPPLYKSLISDLNGKQLPSEEGLVNHIKRTFKLIPTSAEKAANVFIENARYLNLIENNRLKFLMPTGNSNSTLHREESQIIPDIIEREEIVRPSNLPTRQEIVADNLYPYRIPLTGNKEAVLSYPKKELTKKDVEIIQMAIGVLAMGLMTAEIVKVDESDIK